MPIPDANEPKDSNVYKQLSSEQLGTISKSNFDIVQDPVFIDQNNEDELRRINLVGSATGMKSYSGPIPGTAFIHVTSNPSSSAQDGFIPEAGEVWLWMGGGASLGSASGTIKSYTSMYTPARGRNHDGAAASFVIVEETTTSDYTAISYDVPDTNIYVTSNNYLRIQINGTYTSSESSVKMGYVRVR
jgi:hypothetical protein